MNLPPETQATLLLCGGLAPTRQEEPVEPLNVREFNEVLRVLAGSGIALAQLTDPAAVEDLRHDPAGAAMLDGRAGHLLARRPAMERALERWAQDGIWVLARTDPKYPLRFHQHLGESAPPLLYGAGVSALLNDARRRVAAVGSREIDDDATTFARDVGLRSAEVNALLVSGGARGADRAAIDGNLEAGGRAIAILPGSLRQLAGSRAYREAIAGGRLALISPYHPGAKFTSGNAMGRNRLIYCLADAGVVVETSNGTGGTWRGATETLKNAWIPVYARVGESPSEGTLALLELGAREIHPGDVCDRERFGKWLAAAASEQNTRQPRESGKQLGLFGE